MENLRALSNPLEVWGKAILYLRFFFYFVPKVWMQYLQKQELRGTLEASLFVEKDQKLLTSFLWMTAFYFVDQP